MSLKKLSRPLSVFAGIALLLPLSNTMAFAQTSSSTSYKTNEYFFGTGGDPNITSAGYKAGTSSGALGVDTTTSTGYVGKPGLVTAQEEYLEMVVSTTPVNLNTLSTITAATGNSTFYIRAYTSSGYTVQTMSGTPANGAASLAPMTVAALSSPGTEQFGINLVANTSPTTFGAIPIQTPNNTFAFGVAAAGYASQNNFKYNAGDTIASAPKGIGETDFTISYIANISAISKGGFYSVNQDLVVIATY